MKIVVLTSSDKRHDYFCYKLLEAFNDITIIQEPKGLRKSNKAKPRRLLESKHKHVLIKNHLLNKAFCKANLKFLREKAEVETQFFSKYAVEFKARFSHLIRVKVDVGKSINDPEYVVIIRDLKPDVIAVMGTGLLKKDIIETPKHGILNLHTGLSPYYRGSLTNFWPIVNREPQYCGVTVHKLSLGIDSGDIVYNGLPIIGENDIFPTINSKLIILGTELMKKALIDLSTNGIVAKKQWAKGKLYNSRDFNGYWVSKYFRMIRSEHIKRFLFSLRQGKIQYPQNLKLFLDNSLPQYIPSEYQ